MKFAIFLLLVWSQLMLIASEPKVANLTFRWHGFGLQPRVGEVIVTWRDGYQRSQHNATTSVEPLIRIVGKTMGVVKAFRSYEIDASLLWIDDEMSRYTVAAKDRGVPEIREIVYFTQGVPQITAFKDRVAMVPLALDVTADSGRVSPLHVLYQALLGKCSGTWKVYDGKRRYTVQLQLAVETLSKESSPSSVRNLRSTGLEPTERQCVLQLLGETIEGSFERSGTLGFWPFNRQQQTLRISLESTQLLSRLSATAPFGKIIGKIDHR